MPVVSVVVPVYNEEKTIVQILERINAAPVDKEIIVVDDCSQDGTRALLQGILKMPEFYGAKVIYHSHNKGKGESVREGIRQACGEFVVVQDADLEYDPSDYPKLLEPLQRDAADLVLGARFMDGHNGLFAHRLGNKFLTGLMNFLFGARLNDYATCYKMARRGTFEELRLISAGFEIDVEIICKALQLKKRIVEVPVSYYPRSYAQGKKIRWVDGLHALMSIFKYRCVGCGCALKKGNQGT